MEKTKMIFKINVENSNRFVRDRMILVEFNIEIAFNKITKKRYKKSTDMESTSVKKYGIGINKL